MAGGSLVDTSCEQLSIAMHTASYIFVYSPSCTPHENFSTYMHMKIDDQRSRIKLSVYLLTLRYIRAFSAIWSQSFVRRQKHHSSSVWWVVADALSQGLISGKISTSSVTPLHPDVQLVYEVGYECFWELFQVLQKGIVWIWVKTPNPCIGQGILLFVWNRYTCRLTGGRGMCESKTWKIDEKM